MNCKECGSELQTSDDKELKTFILEYATLFTIWGLCKGGYRTFNVFRGHFSKILWKFHGYYFLFTCKTFILKCYIY